VKIGILGETGEAATGNGIEIGHLQGGILGVTMMRDRRVEIETSLRTVVVVAAVVIEMVTVPVGRERRVQPHPRRRESQPQT
jgi:hypothetical protein